MIVFKRLRSLSRKILWNKLKRAILWFEGLHVFICFINVIIYLQIKLTYRREAKVCRRRRFFLQVQQEIPSEVTNPPSTVKGGIYAKGTVDVVKNWKYRGIHILDTISANEMKLCEYNAYVL